MAKKAQKTQKAPKAAAKKAAPKQAPRQAPKQSAKPAPKPAAPKPAAPVPAARKSVVPPALKQSLQKDIAATNTREAERVARESQPVRRYMAQCPGCDAEAIELYAGIPTTEEVVCTNCGEITTPIALDVYQKARETQRAEAIRRASGSSTQLLAEFITNHIDGEIQLHDPLVLKRDAITTNQGVEMRKFVLLREGLTTPYGFIYIPERQAQGIQTLVALLVR